MNTYLWLVRREVWENRTIWTVPAALGILLTLSASFASVDIGMVSADERRVHVETGLFAVGALFFAVMSIYCTWYLLECLYSDRRDRSVLFWKSMPVTDSATVLSKVLLALIGIPLVYFVACDLTSVLMAFIVSLRTRGSLGGALWRPGLWLELQGLWLYAIASAAIWYLPLAGALLIISAWAKRAVLLWSMLLPVAAILAERVFLGSHAIAQILDYRIFGYGRAAFHVSANAALDAASMGGADITPDPLGFVSNTATWFGAAAGIVLILGAIQLRLRRTEP